MKGLASLSSLGALPPMLNAGGGALKALRVVPDTADRFFVVTRADDGIRAVRFQRNVVGTAGGGNLGGADSGWRVTGLYGLASFSSDPAAPAFTYGADAGAFDVVGNTDATTSGSFYGSYHGLGTGQINSQAILVDGSPWDPAADDAIEADEFDLTTDTTATNGTAILTRSLTVSFNARGGVHFALNSLSATGMGMVFVGMAIASGNDYSELGVQKTATWSTLPMGSGNATGRLIGINGARLRNPSDGAFVEQTGSLAGLAGFLRCYILKETSNTRSKSYLGWFTSFGALNGVEWDMDFGTGSAGVVSPPAQMLGNTDFSTGWADWGTPLPTTGYAVAAGVVTMTRQAGAQLRLNRAIDGIASGNHYAVSADIGGTAGLSWLAPAATGGSQASAAFNQLTSPGKREIQVFLANSNTQALQFALGTGSAVDVTVQNPAAYPIVA